MYQVQYVSWNTTLPKPLPFCNWKKLCRIYRKRFSGNSF